MRNYLLAFVGLVILAVIVGCGGGHKAVRSGGKGRATLTIHWPKRTRLIPDATDTVVVRVYNASSVELTDKAQTLRRGADGSVTTMTFTDLPVGTVTFSATAKGVSVPVSGTSTNELATGVSVPVKITPEGDTAFDILMNTTVTGIDVTGIPNDGHGSIGSVLNNAPIVLTATPYSLDATGRHIAVLNLNGNIQWIAAGVGSTPAFGLTPQADGTVKVATGRVGSNDITANYRDNGALVNSPNGSALATTTRVQVLAPSYGAFAAFNLSGDCNYTVASTDIKARMYVTDATPGRLAVTCYVFYKDSINVRRFGPANNGLGSLADVSSITDDTHPMYFTVDFKGAVYYYLNNQVVSGFSYDQSSNTISSGASEIDANVDWIPASITNLVALAAGADGKIYVAVSSGGVYNLQRYSHSGFKEFEYAIPVNTKPDEVGADSNGNIYMAQGGAIHKYLVSGSALREDITGFTSPPGSHSYVLADTKGNIYVDGGGITSLASDGSVISSYGAYQVADLGGRLLFFGDVNNATECRSQGPDGAIGPILKVNIGLPQ